MKVYLARHGDYISVGLKEVGTLSEEGRQEVQQIATLISKAKIEVANIFHSGKKRAEQTAEIFATSFISANGVSVYEGINPEDDFALFAKEINTWVDDVLVIGHLPFMSRLVSTLVVNEAHVEVVNFQQGSLVCLEKVNASKWIINWMLSRDVI